MSTQATSFPPLESINKPSLTTEEAAFFLNRRVQTLRAWACHDDGPLRPIRVHGRLGWPVVEVKKLLGVS